MKVLVADDSVTMRRILANLLSRAGIDDVDEASNGQEAVLMSSSCDYDLILLDWNMPKLLGIDALKTIRDRGSKVPIVMVTTEAEKVRVIEAMKAGANNYVIKPFDDETLLSKIRQTIDLDNS